ncbi:MAG: DUF433 domain-containing protein [Nitrospira sp.]|nr:DUF433 domain-containing protein [Nitrospira sp.]MDH4244509.1 DUF433 domain-containing protein [Nitrospira sp.]MDH4356989.1 DUF433 domain-containing protein [Nitrospira sp.]
MSLRSGLGVLGLLRNTALGLLDPVLIGRVGHALLAEALKQFFVGRIEFQRVFVSACRLWTLGKQKLAGKVVVGRIFSGLVLRFLIGEFTMPIMDEIVSLPEFLVRLPEGVIRVAGTRVSLDSVVLSFQDGATPEEICLDFPSLDLAKVYSVLAYYLTHREIVDLYLLTRQRFVETTCRELHAHQSPFLTELRRRVAAKRALPPACA